jgi:uncharacterized protein YdaU (DUF1376 family)
MSKHPYMQFYQSDFIGDTLHLNTEQLGAYMLLLMAMWNAGGQLPNDDKLLARITRVSAKRWHLVGSEVMEFFQIEGNFITQARLQKEINGYSEKVLRYRENGSLGGKATALKTKKVRAAIAANSLQHRAPVPEPDIDTSLRSASIKPSSLRSDGSAPGPKPTPRSELSLVLDDAHVSAVIDHRQRIRKPLTAFAAKLLAEKFAASPDANQAADMMVMNGWQGFDPSWAADRVNGHRGGRGPPGEPSMADVIAERTRKALDEENARTIETSYERRDLFSPGKSIRGPSSQEGQG